jgi:hypothetical protein
MGERDAFGREKGEDSLAQMGWKSGAPAWEPATVTPGDPPAAPAPSAFDAGEAPSPFARPEPAPKAAEPSVFSAGEATAPFSRPKPRPAEPEPVAAEPPRPRPPAPTFTRRPRRRGPSLARLIFLVAIVGVLAIGAANAVRVGGDAVDGIRDKIKAIEPSPAPSATAPESLLRPAPLKDALTKLPPGKLVFVRIDAGSITAQVIRGGRRHTVRMATTGPNADVTSPAGVDQPGFKLNPEGPLRAARTAARRAGLSVDDIDYIVGTKAGLLVFFKVGGPRYRATLSGRKVTKF